MAWQTPVWHGLRRDLATVSSPRDVVKILQVMAQEFYESAEELNSAHQDNNAGKPWIDIAKQFENMAHRISKKWDY